MTMDCPKCNGRLQETALDVEKTNKYKDQKGAYLDFELVVEQCFVCGGVWFDKGKLDTYLREDIELLHSPSQGAETDRKLDLKKGKCPVCQIEMVQHPDSRDHHIQIDTCEKCGGVWLDGGEIDRLDADASRDHSKTSLITDALIGIRAWYKKKSSSSDDDE